MLHRVAGFTFDYGIFTNLEPDHIGENEHKDFEDYMRCKGLLFRQCKLGIVNLDNDRSISETECRAFADVLELSGVTSR